MYKIRTVCCWLYNWVKLHIKLFNKETILLGNIFNLFTKYVILPRITKAWRCIFSNLNRKWLFFWSFHWGYLGKKKGRGVQIWWLILIAPMGAIFGTFLYKLYKFIQFGVFLVMLIGSMLPCLHSSKGAFWGDGGDCMEWVFPEQSSKWYVKKERWFSVAFAVWLFLLLFNLFQQT